MALRDASQPDAVPPDSAPPMSNAQGAEPGPVPYADRAASPPRHYVEPPRPIYRRTYQFPVAPRTLRDVRRDIYETVRAYGAPEGGARAFQVAVGEALVNAWRHAYRMEGGIVEVSLTFDGSEWTATVRDRGRNRRPPDVPAERPRRGGLGLYLMSRLVDCIEIRHLAPDGGLAVSVKKRFSSQAAPVP